MQFFKLVLSLRKLLLNVKLAVQNNRIAEKSAKMTVFSRIANWS
jgi:hypothetical protein